MPTLLSWTAQSRFEAIPSIPHSIPRSIPVIRDTHKIMEATYVIISKYVLLYFFTLDDMRMAQIYKLLLHIYMQMYSYQ